MTSGKVKWYGKEVSLKLKKATEAMLHEAAAAIEGEAKIGAKVDTGFMRNSIYFVTPKGDSYGAAVGAANSRKKHPSQVMGPRHTPPSNGALVCVGARYATFAEVRAPFLYPAVEKVAAAYEGKIVAAGRKEIG